MSTDTLTSSLHPHPLRGDITVPGDKSISHRAAILAGLAHGTSRVSNFLCSSDCLNTLAAMQQLGATVSPAPNPSSFSITGISGIPSAPQQPVVIDCGNSGTGMRLLAGVLSALPVHAILTGDSSLCSRPMGRIITPLSAMGAQIEARGERGGCAPLEIDGKKLIFTDTPFDYTMPVASAQVKSAILLAGMLAEGQTTVRQRQKTRDHTERMLAHFGHEISLSPDGLTLTENGGTRLRATDISIPGDFSSAAFWMVAACIQPGSEIILRRVGLNSTRTDLIKVLQRMGAHIEVLSQTDESEPYGDLRVTYTPELHGTDVRAEEIPNLIDEIPVLSVAAAYAQGDTNIRNASELRVKESDRIKTVVSNLHAMGANVVEFDDGMLIHGGAELRGCTLDSFGDHRIAMSFLIAGLRAKGTTTLLHCKNIDTSYPNFLEHITLLTR